MSAGTPQSAITLSLADLETLIRRVVHEVVREELTRILPQPSSTDLDDWEEHEGPGDPQGDEELLTEALVMIQQRKQNPEGWKTLEEFEAELGEAETRNELMSL